VESLLWYQEVGRVRDCTLLLANGPDPWFARSKLNRSKMTSVCCLRSGHTALAHSLAHFNIAPNGICACETSEETPDHVFWQRQRFTNERKNLTKGLVKRWKTLSLRVDIILSSKDQNFAYVLVTFISAIKIRM
jgi:hypothetical protein